MGQDNTEIWVVACSGGPDSMALLDWAYQHYGSVIVAHVNYHRRATAVRDQKIVEDWCREHQLPCIIHHARHPKGNFQAWARQERYAFFARLTEEYGAQGVLVAHHQDDLLETYLWQQERGSIPAYWGLKETTQWQNMIVKRPLLAYSKEACVNYCLEHKIPFGIDESNLQDTYRRNQIRHQIVEKLNPEQRQTILAEIAEKNRQAQEKRVKRADDMKSQLSMTALRKDEDPADFLSEWIFCFSKHRISRKYSEEIWRQCQATQHFTISLTDCVKLSKRSELLEIQNQNEVSYCYVLDKLALIKTDWFSIQSSGRSVEAVTLTEADFPITIRNVKAGDTIQLRFGKKRVHRWFIDRKIPLDQRRVWPVVVNSQQEIILVPQIGCDVKHYSNNPTCFVVK